MHVFLTGANGWVGSAITRDLVDAGHSVSGLVRSPQAGEAFAALGGRPHHGEIQDLAALRTGAEAADGIIHLAFGLDLARIVAMAEDDRQAIETFGEVFAGSERPIISVSGFLLLPPGEVLTEDARPPVDTAFPRATEQTTFALAERGLHASVVRLPRSVHGQGERHGFVPMLAAVAREKGVSAYVGDGENLWPSVHRLDAARMFRLALERGTRGQAYHAVAEEGVPFRRIAEAIGRQVGVPAVSLTPAEAEVHFGPLSMWVAGNGPASSARTRICFDWEPRERGLLADIDRPEYHR
jgi:nucleoside-diphosphate-sugar epimerase